MSVNRPAGIEEVSHPGLWCSVLVPQPNLVVRDEVEIAADTVEGRPRAVVAFSATCSLERSTDTEFDSTT
jgi:hypothetical protein